MSQWKKIENMEEYKKKIDIFESIYHLNKKELQEKYVELALRIDKVIEYIKSNEWAKDYKLSSCRTHLLDILGGDEDEEST